MALQAQVNLHPTCCVMVATSATGIHTIEPRIPKGICELTFSAHGVISVFPPRPFHILISSFPEKAMHLPRPMVIAYATRPPIFVMTASSTLHHQPALRASEILDHCALRNKHFVKHEAEQNTALRKALQVEHDKVRNLVEAVHYKPHTDQELQIDERVHQKQNATAQVKNNWSEKVAISSQHHAYRKPFIEMLSQFLCM